MKTDKIFEENPQLTEVYKTSDGQYFHTENFAKLHARNLKDKSIVHLESKQPAKEPKPEKTQEPGNQAEGVSAREALAAKYAELYGKAPQKNAKDETLIKRIAEKEEEITSQKDEDEAEN